MERRKFDAEQKPLPTPTMEELLEAMNIAVSSESIGSTITRAEIPAKTNIQDIASQHL